MTEPDEQLVEACARALCLADFKDPDEPMPITGQPNWKGYVLRVSALVPLVGSYCARIAEGLDNPFDEHSRTPENGAFDRAIDAAAYAIRARTGAPDASCQQNEE